jgi:hypothetical protein
MKFNICVFVVNLLRKFKFSLKSGNNSGYFTWRPMQIYDNISPNSSWNEKYFGRKFVEKNQNTHFMFSDGFSENLSFYEIIWKNTVERHRPKMTIGRMRFACWITKPTDTLIAIPRQELLRERASMLRHTYMACLVEHSNSTRSDAVSSSDSSHHLKGSYIFVFGHE